MARARISKEYIRLSEEWACAAYALISAVKPEVKIEPSSVSQMISVLMEHKLGAEAKKAIKLHGSLFDHHPEIVKEIDETVVALESHAPKRALIFRKLGESYRAALENSETFIIPDDFLIVDFSKPVAPKPAKKDPNMKLPQKILNEWREATLAQMEVTGQELTPEIQTALDENLLVIRANFGRMTAQKFDSEENEQAIRDFLQKITGEPHITVAQYMAQAI